jgi:hypothetical protein
MEATRGKICGRRAAVVLAVFLCSWVAVETAAAAPFLYDPGIDMFRSRIRNLVIEIVPDGHLVIPPCGLGVGGALEKVVVQRFQPDDLYGDGLGDILTEIISMELSGGGITLRESPTQRSLGVVEEKAEGTGFPANSFFDVFVEVDVPGVGTLFNVDPLRMQSMIDRFPPVPQTDYLFNPIVDWWPVPPAPALPLPLYILDPFGGLLHVANIVQHPIHRIVPLPAAFPLGMSALGLLGGYRSWRAWIKRRRAAA